MIPPPAEFSRRVGVGEIGQATCIKIEATPAECDAVAARLKLPAILSIDCSFRLHRVGGGALIKAAGDLRARVVQTCVVSLDSFEATVGEAFAVRFVPVGKESAVLDMEDDDEIPYTDGMLDLGEAAVEQLALALDDFPRKPGAKLPSTP